MEHYETLQKQSIGRYQNPKQQYKTLVGQNNSSPCIDVIRGLIPVVGILVLV